MGRFRDMAGEDSSDAGIDISPLIDCVFILLIFFIVTTTFVEETGSGRQAAGGILGPTGEGSQHSAGIDRKGGGLRRAGDWRRWGSPIGRQDASRRREVPVIIQADAAASGTVGSGHR